MLEISTILFTAHLACADCRDGVLAHDFLSVEHRGAVVGTMVNSWSDRSYFVTRNVKVRPWWGVYAGLTTGYDDAYGPVVPMVAPYVQHGPVKLLMMGDAVAVSLSVKL